MQYPDKRSIDPDQHSANMGPAIKKLSIIVPVYNERNTILPLLQKLRAIRLNIPYEIIVVDDGSNDGTTELLHTLGNAPDMLICYQVVNQGKSHALQVGFERARGDYLLIQDADLEYSPSDIPALINAVTEKHPVVFGSRNKARNPHSSELFYWGGLALTLLTNVLYRQSLTDVATCYKLFPKRLLTRPLLTHKFAICYELTALFSRQHIKIIEVPISYSPRSRKEGKKIRIWDGVEAVLTLLRFRF